MSPSLNNVDNLPSQINADFSESFATNSEFDILLNEIKIAFSKLEDEVLFKVVSGSKFLLLRKGVSRISTTLTYIPVAYSEQGALYSESFVEGGLVWNDLTGDYTLLKIQ